MLLQSQWTEKRDGKDLRIVSLLPALPKAWPDGFGPGFVCRDGFVVDLVWENGALETCRRPFKLGKHCLLRCGGHEIVLQNRGRQGIRVLTANLKPEASK